MAAAPILVGASLSLSGRFAAQGRQAHQGLTLWAEDVDRAGGLTVQIGAPRRPIQLIVHDDASRKAEAGAGTRRLIIEDQVDILLSPYSSVLALAAAEVAGEYDRTLWNHGGSSDAMVERGWSHVVHLLSLASSYFVPLLDMAVQHASRPVKRVALVYGARGTFPAAVIGGAEAHARSLGLEVVLKATYPEKEPSPPNPLSLCAGEGEMFPASSPLPREGEGCRRSRYLRRAAVGVRGNLGALVRQIAELEPDLILGVGTMEADIAFAREIRAQGVNQPLVGLVAAAVQPFKDALGADADGFCGPSQWEPTLQDRPEIGPTSSEFAAAFRARFRAEPDYPAAQAYAAGLIAGRCIGLARSLDDKALRATAATLDTSTFYGRFRTDPLTGQQVGHKIVVVQWQAGRKQVAWPTAG